MTGLVVWGIAAGVSIAAAAALWAYRLGRARERERRDAQQLDAYQGARRRMDDAPRYTDAERARDALRMRDPGTK